MNTSEYTYNITVPPKVTFTSGLIEEWLRTV